MNKLKLASRFPNTVDFGVQQALKSVKVGKRKVIESKIRRRFGLALNLYLISSPSNTLLDDSFSRAMVDKVEDKSRMRVLKGGGKGFEWECGDGEYPQNLI